MIQNMMNHMDEYQAFFQMFENSAARSAASAPPDPAATILHPGFPMPDIQSIQKMMEGSDLVDEFTYVEEPSGTGRDGSEESISAV